MIARLRLTDYKLTRGLQLDRKKLRAVIVIGFSLLASPAEKTKSATAQGAAADLLQSGNRVLALLRLMQQDGQPFLQCQHAAVNSLLDTRPQHPRRVERRVHHGPTRNYPAILLPRCHLRRDQTNVIHTCLMADIENVSHYGEVQSRIALDEHHLLGAGGKNTFQLIQ